MDPRNLLAFSLGIVVLGFGCVTLAADEPAELSKKPQWQRMLQGEDAKTAGGLQKQIDEQASMDDYPGAIQAAQELLALRTKRQVADHHETVTAKQNIAALRKVAALDAAKRRAWRSVLMKTAESDRLNENARYGEALPIEHEILNWHREVLGEDAPETANCYNNVAYNLGAQGKSAEAQALYQKALEINRRVLGEDHPHTAASYNNVAYNLESQGKSAEAQALYQKALEINRRVLGEDHPHTAASYNNVAYNLESQGKSAEAQALYQKALEINRRVLGEDHPDTATSYNNLAGNLDALGKSAEAQLLHQKVMEIRRRVLGEDHPATAQSYNNVAANLNAQGRSGEAQPLYQKALEIRRRVLGEDHPDTAASYNNLASNLNAQGKSAEAQPLYQKALEIRRRVLGEDHPHTAASYNNLASNLNAQGKSAEAQPMLQQALAIRRRVLGEDHPDTATSYNSVAYNLDDQGKSAEAQPLYQKALAIRRRVLGEDHPDTAQIYNNVAGNLEFLGKSAEAQPLYQKALAIRRRVLGEDHPDTAQSYNNVAYNLNAQGKSAEAQPLSQRALEINRRVLGEDHPDTATSYNNVAYNLNAQGKSAEAQPLYQKALEIRRRVLGEDHPHTASSYTNLAFNLAAQWKVTQAEPFLRRGVLAFEASRLSSALGLDRASLAEVNPRPLLAAIQQARQPLPAWGEVELSLARGLLDQQAKAKRNLTPAEEAEWVRERDRVADVQPQILALLTKTASSKDEAAQLNALLSQRREAEERLATLAVTASTREVASSDAIQAALPADAALLNWIDVSFGDVQEHWACVVRHEGDPKWERLPGTGADGKWSEDDEALPTQFFLALADPGRRAAIAPLAAELSAQRLGPVLKHLSGVKRLYVVSVKAMGGIPIEALTADYTISYVPSGTYLARLKDRPRLSGSAILALCDPIFRNPRIQEPTSPTAVPPGGLLVTQVAPGALAARAGLRAGDVLLKYGDTDLKTVDSLKEAIAANATADSVTLSIWRESEEKPLSQEVEPGLLGVGLDPDPAPVVIANRRQTTAMLARLSRGGDWADLPGTRAETHRLRELFGDEATLLADGDASEQRLEGLRHSGELQKYRYLHFATHGAGNSVKAFESSLILAQNDLPAELVAKVGEPYLNGQLSAGEVLDYWKLDAELVTLSACETAIGKPGSGDGLLGFAQAFLTAGSRAVCLSLWKVDDTATALLMGRFYQNMLGKRAGLDKPMGKAAALDEAKRWLRELPAKEAKTLAAAITKDVSRGDRGKGETLKLVVPMTNTEPQTDESKPFSDPRYWAAFILIGDPN